METYLPNSWIKFDADIGIRCGYCFEVFIFNVRKYGRYCPMCGIQKNIGGEISYDDRSFEGRKQTYQQYSEELKRSLENRERRRP